MAPRDEWAGPYARLKAEARKFAALAADAKKRASKQRADRDWVGALNSALNAQFFRDSAAKAKSEAATIRQTWGFR